MERLSIRNTRYCSGVQKTTWWLPHATGLTGLHGTRLRKHSEKARC